VTHCEELPQGVLLYTKRQMLALLQVSDRCLSNMMRRGEISYLKIGGKMVRFRIEDVNRRLPLR
jgi:predicted site-specific integrase-resolvase